MTDTAPCPPATEPVAHEGAGSGAATEPCCARGPSRRDVLAGLGVLGAAATLVACAGSSGGREVVVEGGPAGAVAKVSDVPVGGAVSARHDGVALLVAQPAAGTFVGLSAVCPHEGCTVAPDGGELRCPCHGSVFTLEGAVTRGPAQSDLSTFPLTVDGEYLVADLGG